MKSEEMKVDCSSDNRLPIAQLINVVKNSSNRIPVLHLISCLGRGGRERQISIICSNEVNTCNIVLYYYKNDNDYISEYQLEGKILRLPLGSLVQNVKDIKYILKELHVSALVSWGIMESVILFIVSFILRLPFINFSIQHGVRGKNISHYFRSVLCWISPFVVANSFAGLAANNIKPSATRRVLYNGIDSAFISRLSNEEIESQRKLLFSNYSGNEVVFVSVANLYPYKDYLTVLDAFRLLKNDLCFHYLIVGEGPMRITLENKILEHGLCDFVHLVGSVNNVQHYLAISDYMIHSSKGEGISNAILEGMYAGLPIIASRVGGVPETVYPQSSVLFEYQNTQELYGILKNVNQIFSDFNPYSGSYNEHLDKFSTEKMIAKYEEIIMDVTNGKL